MLITILTVAVIVTLAMLLHTLFWAWIYDLFQPTYRVNGKWWYRDQINRLDQARSGKDGGQGEGLAAIAKGTNSPALSNRTNDVYTVPAAPVSGRRGAKRSTIAPRKTNRQRSVEKT